ncbi:hypothetical protein D770_17975 [Flammeovirgaceae bacterium 311]|nr:hypothetical protein D770_17975 [Flammeovirgaceae bacterium 311]
MLLPLVFVLGLSGCDSGVEMEDIATEELYAVSSWVSPQDTLLQVYLFKANRIGTVARWDSAQVKNALVLISDGTKTDTLLFNPEKGRYESKPRHLQIEPLNQYDLKILTPSDILLEASCSIPPTPAMPVVAGVRAGDDYSFTIRTANILEHQYFSLITFAKGMVEFEDPRFGTQRYNIHARFLNEPAFPAEKGAHLDQYNGIVSRAYSAENPRLFVSLQYLEEGLYKYLRNYQRYDHWQSNNTGALFPNFQEPQPLYSNIKGGVGIFAGYNQATIEVEIQQ